MVFTRSLVREHFCNLRNVEFGGEVKLVHDCRVYELIGRGPIVVLGVGVEREGGFGGATRGAIDGDIARLFGTRRDGG